MNLKVYKKLTNLPEIPFVDPNFQVSVNPSNLTNFVKVYNLKLLNSNRLIQNIMPKQLIPKNTNLK